MFSRFEVESAAHTEVHAEEAGITIPETGGCLICAAATIQSAPSLTHRQAPADDVTGACKIALITLGRSEWLKFGLSRKAGNLSRFQSAL
jgi:hypothetical protein